MRSDSEKLMDAVDMVPWDRIHAYMVLTKWHWGQDKAPSVADLFATVSSLVAEVLRSDRDATDCSTGGFVVSKPTYDSGTEF